MNGKYKTKGMNRWHRWPFNSNLVYQKNQNAEHIKWHLKYNRFKLQLQMLPYNEYLSYSAADLLFANPSGEPVSCFTNPNLSVLGCDIGKASCSSTLFFSIREACQVLDPLKYRTRILLELQHWDEPPYQHQTEQQKILKLLKTKKEAA